MRLYLQKEGSGWIIDNQVSDYARFTRHEVVSETPDVAWGLSLPHVSALRKYNCTKVQTVHHIDEGKIDTYKEIFAYINSDVDFVIVPNKFTKAQAQKYISKPIFELPYWLLSSFRDNVPQRSTDINLPITIGSFQKDSNLAGVPKLIKGPDILAEVLKEIHRTHKIRVLLGGFKRKYIISKLEKYGIPYKFKERHPDVRDLYDKCDWYFVTSRVEGGPQAVLEAPYRGVKILSTDIGMASDVLHPDCICNTVDDFVNKFKSGLDKTDWIKTNIDNNFSPEVVVNRIDNFLEKVWKY